MTSRRLNLLVNNWQQIQFTTARDELEPSIIPTDNSSTSKNMETGQSKEKKGEHQLTVKANTPQSPGEGIFRTDGGTGDIKKQPVTTTDDGPSLSEANLIDKSERKDHPHSSSDKSLHGDTCTQAACHKDVKEASSEPNWLVKSRTKCLMEEVPEVKTKEPEIDNSSPYSKWVKHEFEAEVDEYASPDSKLGLRALGKKYRDVFGKIRCVLIDLSGTIHVGRRYIKGGLEAIELLRKYGIPYRYVTNTTREPKSALVKKLQDFGFPADSSQVETSLTAARRFVDRNELQPFFMLEEEAMEDFEGVSQENFNAVLVGLSPANFCYEKLTQAMRMIQLGAPFIGVHAGKFQENADGNLDLGPGPFIKILETATDTQAVILGKPEIAFYQHVLKSVQCELKEAVMIGDDVHDDVGGPIKHGMKAILVRTGKFRSGNEKKILPLEPTMIALDLLTAVRAVVGAICAERGLATDETSDEDDEGYYVPKRREARRDPKVVNIEEVTKRVLIYDSLKKSEPPNACLPKTEDAHLQPKKAVEMKDLMEPEPPAANITSKPLFEKQ